jgi:hypothetical protein
VDSDKALWDAFVKKSIIISRVGKKAGNTHIFQDGGK